MLRVKAGSSLIEGYINVTMDEYNEQMKKGGNEYVKVFTNDGYVNFRYKYLREVKEP